MGHFYLFIFCCWHNGSGPLSTHVGDCALRKQAKENIGEILKEKDRKNVYFFSLDSGFFFSLFPPVALEFQTLESLAPVSDMLTPVWTKMERLFQRVRGNACRARNASAAWFLLFGFFGLFLVYLFTEEVPFLVFLCFPPLRPLHSLSFER